MTKLPDQALEIARGLPADAQDDIARIVLQLAGTDAAPPVILSDDERTAIAAYAIRQGARDPGGMPGARGPA
ncbi:hypothetical protein [Bradyrhizobium vignae]|uniref:Uncharacterized protein n=1 Tax=Bradyrhizobium vignae TaxID=1549949 RepID=A0A2U3QB24_9BRAD|nr:hypothetical protein [Bradyrhizobium vignae]SPP98587.1 protein of unknown function [Bradyrhizobium vignae]